MVPIQSASEPGFFTETANMGIDGASLDFRGIIPDIDQQMIAGLDQPLALRQKPEEFEFGW